MNFSSSTLCNPVYLSFPGIFSKLFLVSSLASAFLYHFIFLNMLFNMQLSKAYTKRNIKPSQVCSVLPNLQWPHELLSPPKSFLEKLSLNIYSIFSTSATFIVCIIPMAPLKYRLLVFFDVSVLFPQQDGEIPLKDRNMDHHHLQTCSTLSIRT